MCQCIVVHPPGGIAGGDRLRLDGRRRAGTPARSSPRPVPRSGIERTAGPAPSSLEFSVAEGAVLEWLPQASILFDGIDARSDVRVELARDSVVHRFGHRLPRAHGVERALRRRARGGSASTSMRARCTGLERASGACAAATHCLRSRAGLNGAPVFGTFVAMAAHIPDDLSRHAAQACTGARRRRGDAPAAAPSSDAIAAIRPKRRTPISRRCGRSCDRRRRARIAVRRASGVPDVELTPREKDKLLSSPLRCWRSGASRAG